MPPRVLALTDSLAPWHSFWIRVGQFLPALRIRYKVATEVSELEYLTKGDILLVYRYSKSWGNIAQAIIRVRQRGVIIISDIDDYLWLA